MIDALDLISKMQEAGREQIAPLRPEGNSGKSRVTIDIKPAKGSFISFLRANNIGAKSENGRFWRIPVDTGFDPTVSDHSGLARRAYAEAAAKELRRRDMNARAIMVM